MAAPIITSRIPAPNETNVYLNQLIYITFDQAIDSDTLTDNTILLYRASDIVLLGKSIEYDSDSHQVTITPNTVFNTNTTYNIVVVGVDQSTMCVKNESGESLAETSVWYFTTGTEVYTPPVDEQEEIQSDEDVSGEPATKILKPPSSSNLAIVATFPEQYATNLGTIGSDNKTVNWDGPVTIKFNRPMASGVGVVQDWISLVAEPSDGDPSTPFSLPTGTLTNILGDTLTWTPANPEGWSVNNEIIVTISEDAEDSEGNTLGDDHRFMFTTAYMPYYCTVKKIRAAIGPFLRDVTDDAIGRNIYMNSLEIYNIANVVYAQNQWDMDSPTFAAKMWTCCKTQYDLLYAKLLDMESGGPGQLKRLGDFTVQDTTTKLHEGIRGAIDKALACMEAWFLQVLGKYRRAKSQMVVKGISSPATPPMRGVRTWSVPTSSEGLGGNKRWARKIKSPGIYDKWS